MVRSISLLFLLLITICDVIYPLTLWLVGFTFFPFQANGSLLAGPDGKPIGSLLIAQPFTHDVYFQPRPSAASYAADASSSSALAPSNYALRNRIAKQIGPLVKYSNGNLVWPDVTRWAASHPTPAKAAFFDKWRTEHPNVPLQTLPGDFVTTSASGLDPHISLDNAIYQLDRVARAWALKLKRNPNDIKSEIQQMLNDHASAPFKGLIGEKMINVLEINLVLTKRYGAP